jgi:hypothetical protein
MVQAACAAEDIGGAWAASEAPTAYAVDAEGRLQEDADGDAGWCARCCFLHTLHVFCNLVCVSLEGNMRICGCGLFLESPHVRCVQ